MSPQRQGSTFRIVAILSTIFSLLAYLNFSGVLGIVLSLAALVMGIVGIVNARHNKVTLALSIIGVVISSLSLIFLGLLFFSLIAFMF
jgi:hypothetical protein